MRATEIVRQVLDLIDQIDCAEPIDSVQPETQEVITGLDQNRFQQIIDFLTADYHQMYSNSPAETIAGPESVTTNAGGGWNGPKNPADLKSNSISMYPNHLHRPEA